MSIFVNIKQNVSMKSDGIEHTPPIYTKRRRQKMNKIINQNKMGVNQQSRHVNCNSPIFSGFYDSISFNPVIAS